MSREGDSSLPDIYFRILNRKGVIKVMGKLVNNVKKRDSGVPKKDKIIFAILLVLGGIPLLLMIAIIILFAL